MFAGPGDNQDQPLQTQLDNVQIHQDTAMLLDEAFMQSYPL